MRAAALLGAGLLASLAGPVVAQVRVHSWDGAFSMNVTSWRDMPFRTVVRQQYDYSCGSAAVATLLTFHYGRATTEAEAFKAMYAVGDKPKIQRAGFSMLDMRRFLQGLGYTAEGYRMTVDELSSLGSPAIALIQVGRYKHFVVVKGVLGRQVLIGDPAVGVRTMSKKEFKAIWNGVVFAIKQPGAFNQQVDWKILPAAPMAFGVPLSTEALTRELAPLYQITPVIDTTAMTQ